MTKDDLKLGDVITLRDGSTGGVLKNECKYTKSKAFEFESSGDFLSFNSVSNDLTIHCYTNLNELDIVEVKRNGEIIYTR